MEDIWVILKYAFLGLLQGVTEPIPVSSSGHVVIAQQLFGLEIEGFSFEIFVNFASLLAILLIYRKDIIELIVHTYRYVFKRDKNSSKEFYFVVLLIVATIPAGVIGLLFNDFISETFKGMATLGIMLLVTGCALWIIRNLRGRKSDGEIKMKDAVIIGLAQVIALVPGMSRSGATIVAAMGLGLKQSTALKFSFMMYIPVSLGTMLMAGSDLANDPHLSTLALPYGIAFVCSLVATYFSMKWFMGIMAKGNLKIFSFYCWALGLFVLLFLR